MTAVPPSARLRPPAPDATTNHCNQSDECGDDTQAEAATDVRVRRHRHRLARAVDRFTTDWTTAFHASQRSQNAIRVCRSTGHTSGYSATDSVRSNSYKQCMASTSPFAF